MKEKKLAIIIFATLITGCFSGVKSFSYDSEFPRGSGGGGSYYPRYQTPKFDTAKYPRPPSTLSDIIYLTSQPASGQTFKTIRVNGVNIDVQIPTIKMNQIKELATAIAALPKDFDPDELLLRKNDLVKKSNDMIEAVYLGHYRLSSSMNKTVLTKYLQQIKITKDVMDLIKKELKQHVLDAIDAEYRKVEDKIDEDGSDTDSNFSTDSDRELDAMDSTLFMRHAKNGELDIRLTEWSKVDMNIPFFAKIEQTKENTISNVGFVKFGNVLFGAKQKFNTLKNSIDSFGVTNTFVFNKAFIELNLEKNREEKNSQKITLGYDFKDWGITPYLQARSLTNSYAICGVTFDTYNKQSAFLKYSSNLTAQTSRNLINGHTTYTLNTYGQVSTSGGATASYTLKLAPSYAAVKLSLGLAL